MFFKMVTFHSPCRQHKVIFLSSYLHCENTIEILELKLTKQLETIYNCDLPEFLTLRLNHIYSPTIYQLYFRFSYSGNCLMVDFCLWFFATVACDTLYSKSSKLQVAYQDWNTVCIKSEYRT